MSLKRKNHLLKMKKTKSSFTRKNWIDLQLAMMLLAAGASLILNVMYADDNVEIEE